MLGVLTPWKWSICKKIAVKSKFSRFSSYFLVPFLPTGLILFLISDVSLLITFPLTNVPTIISSSLIYLIFLGSTFTYVILNIQFFYVSYWFSKEKDYRISLAKCFKELSTILKKSTEGENLGYYQIAISFLLDKIIKKHVKTWGNIFTAQIFDGYKKILSEELPFLLVFKNGAVPKKVGQMQRKLRKLCSLNEIYPFVSYFSKEFIEFENKDNVMQESISISLSQKILFFLNENYQAISIIITILSIITYFILTLYFGKEIQIPPKL